MFRSSGEAVLIDFGLSHHNQLPDLLQEEFRLPYGTAPYMAPERLLGVARRSTQRSILAGACCCTSSPPACVHSARVETMYAMRRRLWRDPVSSAQAETRLSALAAGSRAAVVWRSSRSGVTPRLRNWRSNLRIPTRSN